MSERPAPDIYATYRALREAGPVQWNGEAWLVLGYREAAAAFQDKSFSSARWGGGEPEAELARWMLLQEGSAHANLRAKLHRHFNRAWLSSLAPALEKRASGRMAELWRRRKFDYVADFVRPHLTEVNDTILGTEFSARAEEFWRAVETLMAFLLASEKNPALRSGAREGLEFLRKETERALATGPALNPNSLLASFAREGADPELVAQVPLLAVATIFLANHLGVAALASLERPAEFAWLAQAPERVPAAVQELMRWESPSQFTSRVATEDVEFFGQVIRRGQRVSLLLGAANRDPAAFPSPDELRWDRETPRHLAWGQGPHACTGAMLGSLVGEAVLRAWLRHGLNSARPPRYRAQWSEIPGLRGLSKLEVELR